MIDDVHHKFSVLQEYPRQAKPQVPVSGPDSLLLNHFRLSDDEFLAASLPSKNPISEEQDRAARRVLSELGVELCFPFMVSTEPFGLLLLKERTEGRRYTAAEVSLLTRLARNLSLALNHIRLKQQITQSQESELLGRMSRGMAHDMNNLVTPVQTLMQLLDEGVPVESLREELLPLAARSIDTLREYIREALFFSEHSHGHFQAGSLNAVIEDAATIVRERCEEKGIKLVLQNLTEATVEMDKSLIKRTIFNVLANAVDASGKGSEIRVKLKPMVKENGAGDWICVQIIDQGEGIPAENLSKIFTPYFTTKNRGDGQRGFGLGLSICRKVVQMHGGSLGIKSQLRHGTTVSINLPAQQVSAKSADNAAATAEGVGEQSPVLLS
jgi:signal transduction histidine kinase